MKVKKILCIILAICMMVAVVACATPEPPAGEPDPAPVPEATPEPDDNNDVEEEIIAPAPDIDAVETHLMVVQPAMPANLDPSLTNDVPSARAHYLIYQTLVYQVGGEIVPGLATSWEFVDAQTIVFTLREGVLFHDGSVLTADDVVFSLNRAANAPEIAMITDMIDEAVALSDNEVQITTLFPFTPILNHLAHSASSIVSREVVERLGDEGHSEAPVGTGPFMFYNLVAGDHFELVRFDDFNSVVPGLPEGQLPAVERITFRIVPDASVRTIELETGASHVLFDVGAVDVSRIAADPNLNMVEVPNFALNTYLGFNMNRAPLDDLRVRQAITYAIDIPTVVDVAWAGLGAVGTGPLPDTVWGYVSFPIIQQNIARAQELMAEAGLEDGFTADIWVNEGNQMRADAATMIQEQLRAINIDITIRIYEWATFLPDTAAGEHYMFTLGWTTVTGDPDYGLYPLYHSDNWGDPGNRTFFSDPRVDELLELGRMETDDAARLEIYREAQELIMEGLPMIPLWQASELHATLGNIAGFSVTPSGQIPLWNVVIG
jgi:peptide/nickel transport system substrate-binding protein